MLRQIKVTELCKELEEKLVGPSVFRRFIAEISQSIPGIRGIRRGL